jgi:predicted Zn-dependent protease with MMP-like domain
LSTTCQTRRGAGHAALAIRTTLYHELGHALGFDEEGVDELGLG